MKCIVGDIVVFKCKIKKGTFDGEVVEVVGNVTNPDDPMLLIHHLIEGGQNYHILQSGIVRRLGNVVFDRHITELVQL